MESTWVPIAASAVLAIAGATAPPSAEAQTKPLSLRAVIHDYAAVDPTVLERAKAVAQVIYRHIGVELTWWGADQFFAGMQAALRAPAVPFASVIHVRLIRTPPANGHMAAPGVLGAAVQGSQRVSLLVEPVEYLANRNRLDTAELLGHVMAHEIAHLLLPPNSHSTTGLMARKMDLFLLAHGGLWFDERQALMIRGRIAARAQPQ